MGMGIVLCCFNITEHSTLMCILSGVCFGCSGLYSYLSRLHQADVYRAILQCLVSLKGELEHNSKLWDIMGDYMKTLSETTEYMNKSIGNLVSISGGLSDDINRIKNYADQIEDRIGAVNSLINRNLNRLDNDLLNIPSNGPHSFTISSDDVDWDAIGEKLKEKWNEGKESNNDV